MIDYSLLNLITIQNIFGAGSSRAYNIYEKISSLGLLDKSLKEIAERIPFSDTVRTKLLVADYRKAEKIIKLSKEHNVKLLKITDKIYPEALKNIDVPPIVLYYKGEMPDFDNLPSITIVGPRKPTEYGKKAAYSLGFRLARAGMIVVSGGALGADTAAHKGAVFGEGITVMVLGCGIDADYLSENKPLRAEVIKKGLIISEYPPLTKPTKYSFPVRNRILSGLTLGTIVVEAAEKSGALITARNATEQGRDVFVIPANPSMKEYKGSNVLLRDGAKPLIDASDIFNEYLPMYAEYLDIERAFSKPNKSDNQENIKKIQKNLQETLSNEAKIVYNHLDKQLFTIDDLSALNLPSDLILSALTELELESLIEALPGGKYKLK